MKMNEEFLSVNSNPCSTIYHSVTSGGSRSAVSRHHGATSSVRRSGIRPTRFKPTVHRVRNGSEVAKLTDDTGTRETHTGLLTLMSFQMHTVPGAENCYRAAEPVGE